MLNNHYHIDIVAIGDDCVGKTCVLMSYIKNLTSYTKN